MAMYSVDAGEVFGRGVLKSEGVVVDKDNCVYGGGRNGIMYKVNPDGQVSELCTLPTGSISNGITMDRQGNLVYCDLGKQAMMRVTQDGQDIHDRRSGRYFDFDVAQLRNLRC